VDDEKDIQTLLAEARAGRWQPVHVLVGDEKFLVDRAARLLKKASVGDGIRGFNDDVFHGQGLSASKVIGSARTLPMMAAARYVLVRDVDSMEPAQLDALAEYVAAPSPSTCVVLTAEKINGTTKLAKAAKKTGAWLDVPVLKGGLLERFAAGEAKRRGCQLDPSAMSALLDAVGNDLAALEDAIERLALYVTGSRTIDVAAVEACVTRVRVDSIWQLVDALAMRRTKVALEAAGSLLDAREPPLRILAMVARQLRMVAKMKDALEDGMRPPDAAKVAGAAPFKANDLANAAKRFDRDDLARAFELLHATDVALKGSKRAPEIVMEETILQLCAGSVR
jgi:DNA polymerase III subunit delta